MKVALFGRMVTIQKILGSLTGNGLEISVDPQELDRLKVMGEIEHFDLAIVDSLAKDAEATCHCLDETGSVPLILVVRGKQADWMKLQSIDAYGYLSDGMGKEELVARMRAIMRRLKPAEPLKQVTFTCIPEKQMA